MATPETDRQFQLNKETVANFAGAQAWSKADYEEDEEEAEDAYPCDICKKITPWRELYINFDVCENCARGK